MAQDIKELLKDYQPDTPKLSKGHEARFEQKLETLFSEKKERKPLLFWMKIAAIIVVSLGLGYAGVQYFSQKPNTGNDLVETGNETTEEPLITLGDLSPDLKKVEDFYVTGINVQLASLQKTPENEELVNGYLQRLEELNAAYKKLNTELNEVGPTEATITALIDNLQLRLELLFKLKNKLKELKNLANENTQNMQA
ncbi:MAG: hypothetical protein R2793_06660 [Flavobacteriaceae bacterium]